MVQSAADHPGPELEQAMLWSKTVDDTIADPYNLSADQIRWVEDTLVGMSAEEKCGQLFTSLFWFGADKGHDIPVKTAWVHNLNPLTDRFSNDPRLALIILPIDETGNSRELAPLAGLVVRGLIDTGDAAEVAPDMANGLARRAFKLG